MIRTHLSIKYKSDVISENLWAYKTFMANDKTKMLQTPQ